MADFNWDDFEDAPSAKPAPFNWDAHADVAPIALPEDRYKPEIRQYTPMEIAGLSFDGPVTGVKQGLTLGWGDEIAGAAGALGAKFNGDERAFWDVYRDVVESVREEQKAAVDQSDGENFAGEMLGSLFVPGVGWLKAAKTAGGFIPKAVAMAKAGAAGGAISGLGNSTADLSTFDPNAIKDAALDTGTAAATGAILGGTLQAGGSTIAAGAGKTANWLKGFSGIDDIVETFTRTKAGQKIGGNVEGFSKANRQLAEQIIDDLQDLRRMSGKFMEQHTDELSQRNIKVDSKTIVDNLRTKIDKLNPIHPDEQKDIETFKQVLNNIVDQQEQQVVSYIPKAQLPKMSNAEKASVSIAKRTAVSNVKDDVRIAQLESALAKEMSKNEPSEARIKKITEAIAELNTKADFPEQNLIDEATDIPVKLVERGNRTPIVGAVSPEQAPVFTPIKKITDNVITENRATVDPTSLGEILRSLGTAVEKSETHVGKQLATEAKQAFSGALETASNQVGAQDVLAGRNAAKEAFQTVGKTQEILGLPDYFGASDTASKEKAISAFKKAIQDYNTPGKDNRHVINKALDELEAAFPGSSGRFRRQIAEGSKLEHLTRAMSKESSYSRNPIETLATAKAAVLQGAEMAGKGAKFVADSSKSMLNLGTKVYDQSPQGIQLMAEAAAKAGKPFANTLNKIFNAPMAKRRALLFALMQQPEFREFAEEFVK